jgi:hypothetical protein
VSSGRDSVRRSVQGDLQQRPALGRVVTRPGSATKRRKSNPRRAMPRLRLLKATKGIHFFRDRGRKIQGVRAPAASIHLFFVDAVVRVAIPRCDGADTGRWNREYLPGLVFASTGRRKDGHTPSSPSLFSVPIGVSERSTRWYHIPPPLLTPISTPRFLKSFVQVTFHASPPRHHFHEPHDVHLPCSWVQYPSHHTEDLPHLGTSLPRRPSQSQTSLAAGWISRVQYLRYQRGDSQNGVNPSTVHWYQSMQAVCGSGEARLKEILRRPSHSRLALLDTAISPRSRSTIPPA